jgi:hypothetical protein
MASQMTPQSVITNIFWTFYPLFARPFSSVTVVFKDTQNSRSFRWYVGNSNRLGYRAYALSELIEITNHSVYHESEHPYYLDLNEHFYKRYSVKADEGDLLSQELSPPGRIPRVAWTRELNPVTRADLVKTKRIVVAYEICESDNQGDVTNWKPGNHMNRYEILEEITSGTAQVGTPGIISYCLKSMNGRKGQIGLISSNELALGGPEELKNALYSRRHWVYR